MGNADSGGLVASFRATYTHRLTRNVPFGGLEYRILYMNHEKELWSL